MAQQTLRCKFHEEYFSAVPALSESLWKVKGEHIALSQSYTISTQMNICVFVYISDLWSGSILYLFIF